MISFIKKYYLDAYIHLSICTSALTGFSFYALSIDIGWSYIAFVGTATFLLYNYHELLTYTQYEWKKWLSTNAALLPAILVLGCVLLILGLIKTIWLPLTLATIGCLLYFVPIMKKNNRTFRDLTWMKIFLIGFVFSMITVVIPAFSATYSWHEIILLALSKLLFISVLALSFDIGDMLTDEDQKTMTLPNVLGIKKAKWIGTFLLFCASMIEIYLANIFILEFPALVIMMITYFLSWIVLWQSSNSKSKYFYLFVVDGLIGLPFLLSFL